MGRKQAGLTSSRAWPLFIAWGVCLSMPPFRWCDKRCEEQGGVEKGRGGGGGGGCGGDEWPCR